MNSWADLCDDVRNAVRAQLDPCAVACLAMTCTDEAALRTHLPQQQPCPLHRLLVFHAMRGGYADIVEEFYPASERKVAGDIGLAAASNNARIFCCVRDALVAARLFRHGPWYYESLVNQAAADGRLAIIELLCDEGMVAMERNCDIMEAAAAHGRLDVMKWRLLKGYPQKRKDQSLWYAAKHGDTRVLDWLRGNGFKISPHHLVRGAMTEEVETWFATNSKSVFY